MKPKEIETDFLLIITVIVCAILLAHVAPQIFGCNSLLEGLK
jgi:hypothetical protein